MPRPKMQKGYTLTELIIVVFILGIFGVIGTFLSTLFLNFGKGN